MMFGTRSMQERTQKLLSELMVPLYHFLMTLTLLVSAPQLKESESLVM
uniref:Uncharacterized protein n=1 Tax=Arundo donax TaxID=35708 RepID=A0A0A9EYA7_ARUDO